MKDYRQYKIKTDLFLVDGTAGDDALTNAYDAARLTGSPVYKISSVQDAVTIIQAVWMANAAVGDYHPLDVTIEGHGFPSIQIMGSGEDFGNATTMSGPTNPYYAGTQAFINGVKGMVDYVDLDGCDIAQYVTKPDGVTPNPNHLMNVLAQGLLSLSTDLVPVVTVAGWDKPTDAAPIRRIKNQQGGFDTYGGYFFVYADAHLWNATARVDYAGGAALDYMVV